MQTNTTAMGGAPHHITQRTGNQSQGRAFDRGSTIDDVQTIGTAVTALKFDEIVLESNEIDLDELQKDSCF